MLSGVVAIVRHTCMRQTDSMSQQAWQLCEIDMLHSQKVAGCDMPVVPIALRVYKLGSSMEAACLYAHDVHTSYMRMSVRTVLLLLAGVQAQFLD